MRKYTLEQLIHYLKKLAKELKKTPTISELNKKKKFPSTSTYVLRFRSWNNALKKAGLKTNSNKYSRKELVDNLKHLAKEFGIPKASHLKKKKWTASYSTYRKHFGAWKKALNAAGIKKNKSVDLRSFGKRRKK